MALSLREVAPGAEIYALNTSSKDPAETAEAVAQAVDWAIEQKRDILTYSSQSFPAEHRPRVDAAVERAHRTGIITIFIHYGHPGNLLPTGLWPDLEDGREPDLNLLHRDYSVLFVNEYVAWQRGEASDWYKPFLSLSSRSPQRRSRSRPRSGTTWVRA